MRGQMHHIDLTVTDPERSQALYHAFLTFLGYEREREFDWKLKAADGSSSVSLVPARAEGTHRTHNRYAPGLHHLAFRADSREDVDRLHALLQEWGATILDAPADYPQYNRGRGYYAVFFADPDGLKLELAWTPN